METPFCIQSLFYEQVKKNPNVIAVSYKGKSWSYAELNKSSNILAKEIVKIAKKEPLIGIYARGFHMITGLLAILKAGKGYLPLSPSYPRKRLEYMLSNAKVQTILSTSSSKEIFSFNHSFLDIEIALQNVPLSTKDICNEASTNSLAYCIYTSGSTGKPKGVLMSHSSLINLLNWHFQNRYVAPALRTLQICSISFDFSFHEIFSTLCSGGTLVIPSEETARDPFKLWQFIVEQKVKKLFLPVALLHQMAETFNEENFSLEEVITTGEQLLVTPKIKKLFQQTGAKLHNHYGATEFQDATTYTFRGDPEKWSTIVPIGKSITNVQVNILDEFLQPVKNGESGELFIGGSGLAIGYLNNQELTKEKFISNPLGQGKLYRTGDIGYYLPDGNIKHQGRRDHQIKHRGFRIEIGEIEAVLNTHPNIKTAAIILQDYGNHQQLVAVVVPLSIGDGRAEWQTFLSASLPDYMIPKRFVILETMPLTPSGKIDRRKLASINKQKRKTLADFKNIDSLPSLIKKASYQKQQTLVKEYLCQRISFVLDAYINDADNQIFLTEIGLDSLRAVELINTIERELSVQIPIAHFFTKVNIDTLASFLFQKIQNQDVDNLPDSKTFDSILEDLENRYQPFPLTDVQQAYWIGRDTNFELGQVSMHEYREMETNDLDLDRLCLSWQKLVRRHEMLRVIVLPSGFQQILPTNVDYKIKIIDLEGKNSEEIEQCFQEIRERMSHQIFPTDSWPLYEICVTIYNDNMRLHTSFDGIAIDWESWKILFREWQELYENPDLILPKLQLSFRDYIIADKKLQEKEKYLQAKEYWFSRIDTLPAFPNIPLAIDPNNIKPKFTRYEFYLSSEKWQKICQSAARKSITPSVVLLTAFAEILTMWSKNSHFTINLTFFNRQPLHPQVRDIIGDFTSLLLLEVDHREEGSFLDRLEKLQNQFMKDFEYRNFSGVQVIREISRRQKNMQHASMPIVFTSALGLREDSDLKCFGKEIYSITQTPQVWLDHQVTERGGELHIFWDVVDELFPKNLIADMFTVYQDLLNDLVEENRWDCYRLSIPVSQKLIQEEANKTSGLITKETLHGLFITNAKLYSNNTAIVNGEMSLTYNELYQRADGIRDFLQKNTINSDLVAVVMEKGWEQVVAVLAILMTGKAYLPIDPNLPEQRQKYLLEQANITHITTQSFVLQNNIWLNDFQLICVDKESANENLVGDHIYPKVPDSLAYVIYTSGSTGIPKGVMIDHRGAVNTILDINKRFQINTSDCLLAISALNFDLSVFDIFGILAAGGTIVIPEANKRSDPSHWIELISQYNVTVWNTVPALMQMLSDYQAHTFNESLRLVMMSGDWIPIDLPNKIKKLWSEVEIISLGGATEASIWSIYYPIKNIEPHWKSIPYGKPLTNQTFFVFDNLLQSCPIWVTGELYIGGIGVAQGYWRDLDKTNSRFIIHPKTGERLYRTGDLGRYLPDGNIEFLGREDFQVKIDGYRIELGEIEYHLLKHSLVKEVVVEVYKEGPTDKLVAYIVPVKNLKQDLPLEDSKSNEFGILSDPVEKLNFKLHQTNLRVLSEPEVALTALPKSEKHQDNYLQRQSYRQFIQEQIPMESFSNWLGCLAQLKLPNVPLPKYRYPSAGGLYPVQTYIYLKENSVENLSEGFYYYNPAKHTLVFLANGMVDANTYGDVGSINRSIFEQAGFGLFLVSYSAAIDPIYGKQLGDHFAILESGYMGQLLMTEAPEYMLGACPIGDLNNSYILLEKFKLGSDHCFIHSFLGGKILPMQTKQWLNLDEKVPDTLENVLQDHLSQNLPSYMIPKYYMSLDSMPLTVNGKVDRKALPKPDLDLLGAEYEEVVTKKERLLGKIWQELLGVKKISRNDNFFMLGGDSIISIQLISKAAEKGILLSMKDVFQNKKLKELANAAKEKVEIKEKIISCQDRSDRLTEYSKNQIVLQEKVNKGGFTPSDFPLVTITQKFLDGLSIEKNKIENIYPLSSMQQGMLFHSSYFDKDKDLYHNQFIMKIKGKLEIDILEKAWNRVIDRHDSLRSSIVKMDNDFVHVVQKHVKLSISQHNIGNLGGECQEKYIEKWLQEDAKNFFDFSRPPLIRIVVFKERKEIYRLILTSHHIICDGWSFANMWKEVFEFYNSIIQKKDANLKEAKQYSDFILWSQKQNREEGINFWREYLKNFDSPNQLGNVVKTGELFAENSFALSSETYGNIKNILKKTNCTINIVIQAAWSILLAKYTNREDVVFGATSSGRFFTENANDMVGLFIHTLPVRIELNQKTIFCDIVDTLKNDFIEREKYSYIPLVEIQSLGHMDKHLSLFESLIVFENYPTYPFLQEYLVIEELEFIENTNYPLTLSFSITNNKMNIRISYIKEKFEGYFIEQIVKHLEEIIRKIANNMSILITNLSILDKEEEKKILYDWNNTKYDFPQDKCIHELFEEQVERTPEKIAIVCGEEQLTYQELNEKANQLAHCLVELGVKIETLIGIYVERSVDTVISILSVIKTGATYIPLDTSFPVDRIRHICKISRFNILLCDKKSKIIDSEDIVVLNVKKRMLNTSKTNLKIKINKLNSIYAIFTSGSTGEPKGVLVSHKSILNFLNFMKKELEITAKDTWLAITTISFDIASLEIYLPLLTGSKIIFTKETISKDPDMIIEMIEKENVSFLQATPSTWKMLVEKNSYLKKLKGICGGEALPENLAICLQKRIKYLWNMYGPTETTIWSSYKKLENDKLSIGKPIDNTKIYILDDNFMLSPIGVIGDIYIGGEGLARGYINKSDITAEKFIPNPFSKKGERLYKTGDLGKWLIDGNIEFCGRRDHQIKLRGYRIELGEIEYYLDKHPSIKNAIVQVCKQGSTDNLVAYVAISQNLKNDLSSVLPDAWINEIEEYLGQNLPLYMIPKHYMLLDSMPLTVNGKIDRKNLPSFSFDKIKIDYEEAKTNTEKILVEIWKQLLEIKKISRNDNFFRLGGNSITVVKLILQASEKGFDLSIQDVFRNPKLRDLAELMKATKNVNSQQISELDSVFPALFSHQKIFHFYSLAETKELFNVVETIKIGEILDHSLLEKCLNELAIRHEVLKSHFEIIDGELIQKITNFPIIVNYTDMDITSLNKEQIQKIMEEEVKNGFDSSRELLARFTLIKLRSKSYLIICISHLIIDRTGLDIFIKELFELYVKYHQKQPLDLPTIPITYPEFLLQEKSNRGNFEEKLKYWKQKLTNIQLWNPKPREETTSAFLFPAEIKHFKIPDKLATKLSSWVKNEELTLLHVLLSVMIISLYKRDSFKDILIGAAISNRNSKNYNMIGCFFEMLLLRISPTDELYFVNFAKKIKEEFITALENKDVPFDKILDILDKNIAKQPYQAIFNFNPYNSDNSFDNLSIEVEKISPQPKKILRNISINIKEWKNNGHMALSGICSYRKDIFNGDEIETMLTNFIEIIDMVNINRNINIKSILENLS